ncbi:Na+/H+ antiporter subunit G [Nitrincola iocasae]|uniref:Na+/H+ antiporter subunit G n=1 Tax=Nitrincola iocasae TaxID=2614693 RepID=A0A5J6LBD7_9GAMM|nr:Na+/H+ antiporter subunit G [Nitrincola iocasae]QEW05780.1 Na+/H+ antiporter subunit G [Nitrincola iocasae]
MNFLLELIVSIFLLTGGVFILVGSIGLVRLPDFFMRLHAPTKATTLGMGGLLIASMILFTLREPGHISVHELLITLFLFITAPVSAHMMAKTALHQKLKMLKRTQGQHLVDTAARQEAPAQTETVQSNS